MDHSACCRYHEIGDLGHALPFCEHEHAERVLAWLHTTPCSAADRPAHAGDAAMPMAVVGTEAAVGAAVGAGLAATEAEIDLRALSVEARIIWSAKTGRPWR